MKRAAIMIAARDHGYEYGVIEQNLDKNGNVVPRSDKFVQLGIAVSFDKAKKALERELPKYQSNEGIENATPLVWKD